MSLNEKEIATLEAIVEKSNLENLAEFRKIAKLAVEEAINETFRVLGIDLNDLDHIERFRDNQVWVRDRRRMSGKVTMAVIIALSTMAATGIAGLVWAQISG